MSIARGARRACNDSNRCLVVVAAAVAIAVMMTIVVAAPHLPLASNEIGATMAYAQEQESSPVSVTSVAVGTTTLLTVSNTGGEGAQGISSIRIWLDAADGAAFKSFKTENGWIGQKTPQDVIVFTAAIPLRGGETAKLGVETDKTVSGINWSAIGQNGDELLTGKSVPSTMSEPVVPPEDVDEGNNGNGNAQPPPEAPPEAPPDQDPVIPSITDESDFRIIPAKPSVGSTIRVAGEKFGPEYDYTFSMNDRVLGIFSSDENGRFVTTIMIPSNAIPDRVIFVVRDSQGGEVSRSLRLNPAEQRVLPEEGSTPGGQQQGQISISAAPGTVKIGDRLSMHGTGAPDSTVVVYTTGPDEAQIRADIIRVDQNGIWSVNKAHLIGADSATGTHTTTVTNGKSIAQTSWTVVQEERATLESSKIVYDRGETMSFVFKGDQAGIPVRVDLEDPKGQIMYSNIVHPDSNGTAAFEYKTDFGNEEGTYTLIAAQGEDKEFLFVGLGQLPSIKIRLDLDKVNYRSTETAVLDIAAKPSDTLRLTVLDESDNIAHSESINVQSDGRTVVTLDLTEFANGVYTAEIEKGTEKASKDFTVGLQSGSTNIEVIPIRAPYLLGEQFLVSIDTGDAVVPITATLTDPEGSIVLMTETFSSSIRVNKDDDRNKALVAMQIPASGMLGTWTITANSGGNVYTVPIEVIPEGMSVRVQEINGDPIGGIRYVDITVTGAAQTVWLEVMSRDGTPIGEEQKVSITDEDVAYVKWAIPTDIIAGNYTLHVRDAYGNKAHTYIIIE